jgi:uncharacterized protein DUF6894
VPNRFYFHVENPSPELDPEGTEPAGIKEARSQAIALLGEMLQDADSGSLWDGAIWRVWVTDAPEGGGRVVIAVQVAAST